MSIMEYIVFNTREEFRNWLITNSKKEKEIWVAVQRKRPTKDSFTYLDAVEEALCFGWIDSIQKKDNGVSIQRFSPRKKNSPWTELNKERARRLIKLGLMTKEGRKVLPPMGKNSFVIDEDILNALRKAKCVRKFKAFHPLYQRVRAYNVAFYKSISDEAFKKGLDHFIEETKKGKMYGNWNDYGRLLNY